MIRKNLFILLFLIYILCGCSKKQENVQHDLKENRNHTFFFQDTESRIYHARFTGLPTVSNDEVALSIMEISNLQDGVLYELKINADEEVQDRYGIDRLNLGYFFVKEDKIYVIRNEEIQNEGMSEETIVSKGILVCQEKEKKDILNEDEPGWHEYIVVDDNRREYYGYNTLVETGYYEKFVWELGKGLIAYKSGYGAEAEDIELHLLDYRFCLICCTVCNNVIDKDIGKI